MVNGDGGGSVDGGSLKEEREKNKKAMMKKWMTVVKNVYVRNGNGMGKWHYNVGGIRHEEGYFLFALT